MQHNANTAADAVAATIARWAGPLALVAFVAAVAGFGAALPEFGQLRHPVALLGAEGIPHAAAFNLCGFLLAGLLAAMQAGALLKRLPAGAAWSWRIGAQLLLLAALAFAAMGVFPLDPNDLDDRASQYHATAWLLWTVAFVAGAVLLAAGLRRWPGGRPLALASLVAGLLVGLLGLGPAQWLHPALAQRGAFLAWLLWAALAGRAWPVAGTR